MRKFYILFVIVACAVFPTVFAQHGSAQQPLQTNLTTPSQSTGASGSIRLPTRNDSAAVAAKNAFDAAQRIIVPPPPANPFSFIQLNLQERRENWQQALDTINTLLVFIEPPSEDPQKKPPEKLPDMEISEQPDAVNEQPDAVNEQPDTVNEPPDAINEQQDTTSKQADTVPTPPEFVPDALIKAYYLLGKALIYQDMVMSGLFNRIATINLARRAVENFEAFVQNGVGNTTVVFPMLSALYSNPLNEPFRALRWINRGITAEPRNAFFHIKRSQLLRDMGRPMEACESLRQARDFGETTATTLMQLHGCR
jgi:hypothetical protein